MSSPVVMREMGELPVSIGTSFSLQGLYNTHPDKKPENVLPASKGEVSYINLRTMLRNIFNATETDKVIHVKAKDYVTALKDEIKDISSFMENQEQTHKRRERYKGTHPRSFKEKYKELQPEKYTDTVEKIIKNFNA